VCLLIFPFYSSGSLRGWLWCFRKCRTHGHCLILRQLLCISVSLCTLFWICRIFAFSYSVVFSPLFRTGVSKIEAGLLRVLQYVRLYHGWTWKEWWASGKEWGLCGCLLGRIRRIHNEEGWIEAVEPVHPRESMLTRPGWGRSLTKWGKRSPDHQNSVWP